VSRAVTRQQADEDWKRSVGGVDGGVSH
jgi:hypothetical protein